MPNGLFGIAQEPFLGRDTGCMAVPQSMFRIARKAFRTVKGARRAIATLFHVTEEPFPRAMSEIPPVSRFCFADFCSQYFIPRGTYNYSFRTVFYTKQDCTCDGIAMVWQWWECIFHSVTSNGFAAMLPHW